MKKRVLSKEEVKGDGGSLQVMSQIVDYENTEYQLLKRHECARIDIYIKYLKEIKSNEILVHSIEKYHKSQEKADDAT